MRFEIKRSFVQKPNWKFKLNFAFISLNALFASANNLTRVFLQSWKIACSMLLTICCTKMKLSPLIPQLYDSRIFA